MCLIWMVWLVLTTAEVVLSQKDIQVECGKDSFTVRWKLTKAMAEMPFKLILGDCFPSKFLPTADGGGEAVFQYRFSDCNFRKERTPEELIYENDLIFKPLKWNIGLLVHPIKCVSERALAVEKPAFGLLQSHGELTFHLDLLNGDLSGPAVSNTFPLGTLMNIQASVAQQAHQSLILYFEECVASNAPKLDPQSVTYPIITNDGCLVDGKTGASRFLPRDQTASLVLQLQTLKFSEEQAVYVHCKLAVWDPEDFSEENKACNYNQYTKRWELLDDPFQNDLCHCCDYGCNHKTMQISQSGSQEPSPNSVLGPLYLTATK